MRQRVERIEGVLQAALGGNGRHELGDTLRSGMADDPLLEFAFLPDQAGKKSGRDVVRLRRRGESVTYRFDGNIRRRGGRPFRLAQRVQLRGDLLRWNRIEHDIQNNTLSQNNRLSTSMGRRLLRLFVLRLDRRTPPFDVICVRPEFRGTCRENNANDRERKLHARRISLCRSGLHRPAVTIGLSAEVSPR